MGKEFVVQGLWDPERFLKDIAGLNHEPHEKETVRSPELLGEDLLPVC